MLPFQDHRYFVIWQCCKSVRVFLNFNIHNATNNTFGQSNAGEPLSMWGTKQFMWEHKSLWGKERNSEMKLLHGEHLLLYGSVWRLLSTDLKGLPFQRRLLRWRRKGWSIRGASWVVKMTCQHVLLSLWGPQISCQPWRTIIPNARLAIGG